MSVLRDEFGFLKGWVVLLSPFFPAIFFVMGLLFVFNSIDKYRCDNFEKITGRKAQWVDYDACYVETEDGKMIRTKNKEKGL